jgi:hypothetical protein
MADRKSEIKPNIIIAPPDPLNPNSIGLRVEGHLATAYYDRDFINTQKTFLRRELAYYEELMSICDERGI